MTTAPAPALVGSHETPRHETGVLESLRPVRDALLRDATRAADLLVADARTRADRRVADADAEVASAVADVERRAQLSAAARAAQATARARTRSHASMLRTRTAVYEDAAAAVRVAVIGLRDDERYTDLLRHFESRAREQLGPEATVTIDPDPHGGVVATAGPRRVDYTLEALADRALDALADEVAALWT